MSQVLLGDLVLSMYEGLLLEHCDSEVAGLICATNVSELQIKSAKTVAQSRANARRTAEEWHPALLAQAAPQCQIRPR